MRFPSFVVLAALSLAACAKNLPNTEIRDTPDTRAIVAVVDAYRKAFDTRNAAVALGEIIGETTTEDVLSEVFANFCIGK